MTADQTSDPAARTEPAAAGADGEPGRTGDGAPDGEIVAEYRKLKATGCDFDKYNILTPLEARVLRNVPFALAGRPFDSPELRALYAADGTWYKPGTSKDVALSAEDEACVDALAKLERSLRARIQVDKEIEAVLTRHPAIFLGLRAYATPGKKVEHGHATKSEFEWQWVLLDADCEGDDCGGITLMCSQYGDDPMSCEVHPIG